MTRFLVACVDSSQPVESLFAEVERQSARRQAHMDVIKCRDRVPWFLLYIFSGFFPFLSMLLLLLTPFFHCYSHVFYQFVFIGGLKHLFVFSATLFSPLIFVVSFVRHPPSVYY